MQWQVIDPKKANMHRSPTDIDKKILFIAEDKLYNLGPKIDCFQFLPLFLLLQSQTP